LPDHFPLRHCWILCLSLVSVSRYQSLLIVTPVVSQSIHNITFVTITFPTKRYTFLGLWTSNCTSYLFFPGK